MNIETVKSADTILSHEEIAHVAHAAWQRDGCPEGRDLHYWLEAESQLKATRHLLVAEAQLAATPKRRVTKARAVNAKSR